MMTLSNSQNNTIIRITGIIIIIIIIKIYNKLSIKATLGTELGIILFSHCNIQRGPALWKSRLKQE